MCAQFLIKSRLEELKKKFGVHLSGDFAYNQLLDQRVWPYKAALVVVRDVDMLKFKSMSFSLVPSWSKEPKVKFATHNARIETVAEKPTWKKSFLSKRCLVPLTHFIEPIYTDAFAGNMVQFFANEQSVLVAAGLYDEWLDQKTGEIFESFAILTDEPPAFVAQTGHDRCPIFLDDSSFSAWLDPDQNDPKKLIHLLKQNRATFDLSVSVDRPLAKGWEKRASKA